MAMMNVYDAMTRIWWHEPLAFISVIVNHDCICVLCKDDEPNKELKERLKSLECPEMLHRTHIPGFLTHIRIEVEE